MGQQYPATLHFHDKYTKLIYGETNFPYKIDALLSDEQTLVLKAPGEIKEPYSLTVLEGPRRHKFIILYKEHPEESERNFDFADLKQLDKIAKEFNNTPIQQTTKDTTTTTQAASVSDKTSNNAVSLITDADNFKKSGKLEDAQKKYEQALLLDPGNDYAQAKLNEVKKLVSDREAAKFSDIIIKANNAFTANNFNEALGYYTEALKLKNDDIYINNQIQLIQTKIEDAKIEDAKRRTDSMFESYISAGDKALKDTLYSTAKIAYNEALSIKPGNSVVLLRIKTVNDRIYSDSVNTVHEKDEALYISYLNAGDKALQDKLYEQAKSAYKEALKIKPNDAAATAKLNQVDTKIMVDKMQAEQLKKDSLYTAYMNSGDKAFKDSLYDVAKASYNSALNIKPGDSHANDQVRKINDILTALQKQAEKNVELQKNQERQNEYISVIALADKDYDAGNYMQAKDEYNKALQINKTDSYSKNKIALINKIFIDTSAKHTKDSIDNFKYTNLIIKADKAYASKDYTTAKQSYTDALKYKDDAYAKNKLAEIDETLAETAALNKAAKDSALKQKETNKKYSDLITNAKTAYSKKDFITARVMYAAATELKPNETEPKVKLAKIDSEQAKIAADETIKNKLDSLKTSAEIALASNEFPLALDNFKEALALNQPDEEYYLKQQISYINYQLKVAEQQRKDEELQRNFDTAISAYRHAKEANKNANYEDALINFKKFLNIINSIDSASLSKSDYNLDGIISYTKRVIPNLESYTSKLKTDTAKKDNMPAAAIKVYGSYVAMLYYPNPKDPALNYVYEKYPELNLNASPADQHFDSLLNYGVENNLISREIMSLKPDLELKDSFNHVTLICQNIKFRESKVYYKFLILNRDTTEFLTGKMLLSNHNPNGDSVKHYPNYVANYPIILPGRQKVVVYVTKAITVADNEQLNFTLLDRLNKYKFSINIPGIVYNQEKQH